MAGHAGHMFSLLQRYIAMKESNVLAGQEPVVITASGVGASDAHQAVTSPLAHSGQISASKAWALSVSARIHSGSGLTFLGVCYASKSMPI